MTVMWSIRTSYNELAKVGFRAQSDSCLCLFRHLDLKDKQTQTICVCPVTLLGEKCLL